MRTKIVRYQHDFAAKNSDNISTEYKTMIFNFLFKLKTKNKAQSINKFSQRTLNLSITSDLLYSSHKGKVGKALWPCRCKGEATCLFAHNGQKMTADKS